MEILNTSFCSKRSLVSITLLLAATSLIGQGNCLLYPADSGERIACELSYRAIEYTQGSKESQLLFDAAIEIGPKYAWAYYEKSVPYFKRGLFADGIALLNKAIELEPENYLYYRAYWFFHNRSYEMCIQDLEELYVSYKAPYTSTPGGGMEMQLVLAMAHAQSGNISKGIEWALALLDSYGEDDYLIGDFDHYGLGLMYFKDGQMEKALGAFEKQLAINPNLAETYYYLGMVSQHNSETSKAQAYFKKALSKFNGEDGGFRARAFQAYNLSREEVEAKVKAP